MDIQKKQKDILGSLFINSIRVLFAILVIVLFLLIGKIVLEGIGMISFEFIFDEPKNNMTEGGIGPAIFGTIAVTIIMVAMAVPLGVFSAIYLSEYAKDSFFYRIIPNQIS